MKSLLNELLAVPEIPANGVFRAEIAELDAIADGVGMADISDRSKVEILGSDARKLLNNLCTNDINKLAVSFGVEAFFLDVKGKLLDFFTVYAGEEALWMDAAPDRSNFLIKHLDRYVIREDVKLTDATTGWKQWHVVGSKAPALIAAWTGLNVEGWPLYRHQHVNVGDASVVVRRHDRSVQTGFDLLCAEGDADTLVARWRPHADNITRLSPGTLDLLRIQALIPLVGKDIDADNLAQEVGRDALAISFNKGCYLGQETVARLDAMGHVNKRLTGVTIDGDQPVVVPAILTSDGQPVGKLTSATWDPEHLVTQGIVTLRVKFAEPGTTLQIGERTATVAARRTK